MPVDGARAIARAARELARACLADIRPALRMHLVEVDPLRLAFPPPLDTPPDMDALLRRLDGQ